ncbi:MAG: diguanylate cyclase [Magnetococcales bacterium]|nr:diguanylate cyclase [Magnetococcales bacterium]
MADRRDTILIVDDERFSINELKEALEENYDIMVAMNGGQALKRAAASPPPDLILLDIMMPGMDGYQVLERLKSDNATHEIPVIFITGLGDSPDEARGLVMGAADYIVKPFSLAVVAARVRTQLRLKWGLERERQLNRTLARLNDEMAEKNVQLINLNKTLQDMVSVDGLTGIPNRRRFDEYLEQEWNRSLRDRTPFSVILLDVDFFKLFNDNYGHAAGDECLKQVGRALASAMVRTIDMVARYGGEEFVCILPTTDNAGLLVVGERLRASVEALRLPHALSKVAPHVTVSLGGATAIPVACDTTAQGLLLLADQRLYKAKDGGRNRLMAT